jgi:hypothetical protein
MDRNDVEMKMDLWWGSREWCKRDVAIRNKFVVVVCSLKAAKPKRLKKKRAAAISDASDAALTTQAGPLSNAGLRASLPRENIAEDQSEFTASSQHDMCRVAMAYVGLYQFFTLCQWRAGTIRQVWDHYTPLFESGRGKEWFIPASNKCGCEQSLTKAYGMHASDN